MKRIVITTEHKDVITLSFEREDQWAVMKVGDELELDPEVLILTKNDIDELMGVLKDILKEYEAY